MTQFIKSKEYIERKVELTSIPRVLNIEVTNRCNLKCPICPSKKGDNFGFLSIKLLKKIINENINILNGQSVWLHFGGEPLLHPNLIEIIKLLKKNNVGTMLSTNCTLLNKQISFDLLNAGLDYIVFSADGYYPKTYEQIRVGADFKEVKKNILNFLEIKKKYNFKTKTQIQFIKLKTNIEEVKKFIKEWKNTSINHINIKSFCTRAGRVSNINEFALPDSAINKDKRRRPCFYLWETLIILWNGEVVACCQDLKNELKVGNLKNQTLSEIWNSPKLVKIRERQIRGDFSMEPCSMCSDWKYHPTNYVNLFFNNITQSLKERLFKQIIKDEGIRIIINHN